LREAQEYQTRSEWMTVNEVREATGLEKLDDNDERGKMIVGLERLKQPTFNNPNPNNMNPANPEAAQGVNAIEKPEEKNTVNKQNEEEDSISMNPSLSGFIRGIVDQYLDKSLSREEAYAKGVDIINRFAKLEEERARMWVQMRLGKTVELSPEMADSLELQRRRYISDFENILKDATKETTT